MDAKPKGKSIGYARVSTDDQELRVQIDALEREGCWNIYKEKASAFRPGRRRPQLELALIDLRPGDVFVVYRLDRLARNIREGFKLVDRIHAAGAKFKSLTEGIDYSTPIGELMFTNIMGWAQFESALTALRTTAGINAIRARGYKVGAKMLLKPERAAKLVKLRKEGKSIQWIADHFKVSTATVQNYLRRAEAAKAAKRKR